MALFCLTKVAKTTNLSYIVSLWYESWRWFLIHAILEKSMNNKMVNKIYVGMSATDIHLHQFKIFVKMRTLNNSR